MYAILKNGHIAHLNKSTETYIKCTGTDNYRGTKDYKLYMKAYDQEISLYEYDCPYTETTYDENKIQAYNDKKLAATMLAMFTALYWTLERKRVSSEPAPPVCMDNDTIYHFITHYVLRKNTWHSNFPNIDMYDGDGDGPVIQKRPPEHRFDDLCQAFINIFGPVTETNMQEWHMRFYETFIPEKNDLAKTTVGDAIEAEILAGRLPY